MDNSTKEVAVAAVPGLNPPPDPAAKFVTAIIDSPATAAEQLYPRPQAFPMFSSRKGHSATPIHPFAPLITFCLIFLRLNYALRNIAVN